MPAAIKLIVGLGNPGSDYETTRHNAGVWFIQTLCDQNHLTLKTDKKFFGKIAKHANCHLLFPTTFMNNSGQAVAVITKFFKITAQEILVVHDELDLPAGTIKIKQGGGHAGHNGIRSIIQHLGTPNFLRLRIGINHPGHKDKVTHYVLSKPNAHEQKTIQSAIIQATNIVPWLLTGDIAKATHELHTTS